MARFQYNGSDERSFPTIGVTVKSGDSFDAPDYFAAVDVSPVSAQKKVAPATTPTTIKESE